MTSILVRLAVSEKDEPYPGAQPLTVANVVARANDVLSDSTKHDEIIGWRVSRVTLVQPKTAVIRQRITEAADHLANTADKPNTSDADCLRLSYMSEGLQQALAIIEQAIAGK